jgi:hypothetical protein
MFLLNGITTREMRLSMESKPLLRELSFYLDLLKFESSILFSASKLKLLISPIYNRLLMIKITYNK